MHVRTSPCAFAMVASHLDDTTVEMNKDEGLVKIRMNRKGIQG